MKLVRPKVIKLGETKVDPSALQETLKTIGVSDPSTLKFLSSHGSDGQTLIEFAGRICYESYEPGLNPNVVRIRDEPSELQEYPPPRRGGDIRALAQLICALVYKSRFQ